jgi:AcrR family transcriptional regulator
MNEIRQKIMEAVINQFNSKGMKFTMDDISKELHISKKTI